MCHPANGGCRVTKHQAMFRQVESAKCRSSASRQAGRDRGPGGEGRAGAGSCALTSEKSGDALPKASVMRSLRWFAGAYFVEEL